MGNGNELKQQLRGQQYRYVDRRSLFPPETKEEYYNSVTRQVKNLLQLNGGGAVKKIFDLGKN